VLGGNPRPGGPSVARQPTARRPVAVVEDNADDDADAGADDDDDDDDDDAQQ
jgi:hypothetical protein